MCHKVMTYSYQQRFAYRQTHKIFEIISSIKGLINGM